MNLRLCFLLSALWPFPSFSQEPGAPRNLIIAAVGEIPTPRLRVVESNGLLGYEPDESSTDRWFPKEWIIISSGKSVPLRLGLNIEPVVVTLPAGATGVALVPADRKEDEASPKPKPLPAASPDGPAMLLLFNRAPDKPWQDGFSTHFLSCAKLDPLAPCAVILNLSGATLTFTGRDRLKTQLPAGDSGIAPILVNAQSGVTLLPLSASAGEKNYTLDVCPLDFRMPYCPIVVVYPSVEASMRSRPLKVSIIQPSAALLTKPAVATDP